MKFILFILTSLILIMLVSGGYIFFFACVRKKELRWLVEEEVKQTPYKVYYDHILSADRWLTDHDALDVYIKSDDGLRLHGLWIQADKPRGTILLAHGYRSSYLVDFSMAFDFYHQQGLNILVPDQRSHGKSEGRFITFGVKESRDMLCWIAWHNKRFGKQPMLLSGMSMGASTVLYLADKPLPSNICGLIADCGFTSPWEILSLVYRRVTHLPAWSSMWAAELFARLFAGFSLREEDSRACLGSSRLPILMIHGTEDGFVPCRMSREGYEACGSEKRLLLVEGADHGVSYLKDRQGYSDAVINFIRQYLYNKEN